MKERISECVLTCNMCGSGESSHILTLRGFRIVRCMSCRSFYVQNPPPIDDLMKCYSEDAFEEQYHFDSDDFDKDEINRHLAFADKIAVKIERIAGIRPRHLDVGCGYGFLMKAAQSRGWETSGIDISEHAIGYCRDNFGLNVCLSSFLEPEQFGGSGFDVVTILDVLEHVVKPRDYLRRASQVLKAKGVLVASTVVMDSLPALMFNTKSWFGLNIPLVHPPEHLFYFSTGALEKALQEEGFNIVVKEYRRKAVTIDRIVTKVARKRAPAVKQALPRRLLSCQVIKKKRRRVVTFYCRKEKE